MKDKYEYIAIYIDDLLIVSEEPQKNIQDLKDKCMLKIKGDGPLEYHLGCDYKLGKDGTLVAQPTKYINKILDSYKKMFPNENFINAKSPLEKNDHPELDNSELCNEVQITKYMSMIGQLQWAITLGRYDVLAEVMSISRFRLAPDRIPSTTPGAEPPRDARDSGSARSHSMHLETSSSDRP